MKMIFVISATHQGFDFWCRPRGYSPNNDQLVRYVHAQHILEAYSPETAECYVNNESSSSLEDIKQVARLIKHAESMGLLQT